MRSERTGAASRNDHRDPVLKLPFPCDRPVGIRPEGAPGTSPIATSAASRRLVPGAPVSYPVGNGNWAIRRDCHMDVVSIAIGPRRVLTLFGSAVGRGVVLSDCSRKNGNRQKADRDDDEQRCGFGFHGGHSFGPSGSAAQRRRALPRASPEALEKPDRETRRKDVRIHAPCQLAVSIVELSRFRVIDGLQRSKSVVQSLADSGRGFNSVFALLSRGRLQRGSGGRRRRAAPFLSF